MTDDLVKRPDDEQDDLTLVYMWAYKMAEKKYKSRIEQLEAKLRDVIDAWDWWQVDTYDRCGSVPEDAIRNARAALGEKTNG
jgi:hypothetical protein